MTIRLDSILTIPALRELVRAGIYSNFGHLTVDSSATDRALGQLARWRRHAQKLNTSLISGIYAPTKHRFTQTIGATLDSTNVVDSHTTPGAAAITAQTLHGPNDASRSVVRIFV